MKQAQCPECGGWSDVAWKDEWVPSGGWWWANGDFGCPKCGAYVSIETEATGWRDVPGPCEATR